ncbi:hypothetical protein BC829DRAFT_417213 [Chytridium lagenaria]|nr:hypothetical protein BC829DRAFT_417213 [Chytridium lagenaria]
MAFIPDWSATVAQVNPSIDDFVELIEARARKVMMKLIAKNKFLSSKLAYLLMIHGDRSILENVKFLLDQLDDGSSIILIHVDLQSDELYQSIASFLLQREADMNAINRPNSKPLPGNVYMAQNRYRGRWGHISLVWMQLSGFYELLDMADWHHVINLSAFNVPLRKSREIHRVLDLPANRDKKLCCALGRISWKPLPNKPGFLTKVSFCYALLTFPPNKIHPKVLNYDDRQNLDGESSSEKDNPKYLFARKIDIRSEEGKRLVEWIQEHHIRKHLSEDPNALQRFGG